MIASADRFYESHELDGIEQCLRVARKALKVKCGQDLDKIRKNQECLDYLEQTQAKLEKTTDQTVQNYISFRRNMKIANLSSKLVQVVSASDSNATSSQNTGSQSCQFRISTDQIHNMLLNP